MKFSSRDQFVDKFFLAVDYRLSGEARHPAQLLDALAGYRHLVQGCRVSPERIIIIADCAGGRWLNACSLMGMNQMASLFLAHLTLMLLRYLKDESIFKLPGGIMLLSVGIILNFWPEC